MVVAVCEAGDGLIVQEQDASPSRSGSISCASRAPFPARRFDGRLCR